MNDQLGNAAGPAFTRGQEGVPPLPHQGHTLTTPDRAEINRRNAQKCTGPKTAEGKSRSRFNVPISLSDLEPVMPKGASQGIGRTENHARSPGLARRTGNARPRVPSASHSGIYRVDGDGPVPRRHGGLGDEVDVAH